MAPEKRSGSGLRRGIQVKTVRREGTSREVAEASGSGSGTGLTKGARAKTRPKKPSARYREKVLGAARPGENFFPDAKMAEQFEQRVLEIYAPTPDLNESFRDLPLRLQAQRDGSSFRLPRLGDSCLEVISNHFSTRVLPLLQQEQEEEHGKSRRNVQLPRARKQKRRKLGILGVPIQDEEEDHDFQPDSTDTPRPQNTTMRSSKAPRPTGNQLDILEEIHQRNSFLLSILPISAKQALQKLMEKKCPQQLTCHVIATYFLTRSALLASRSFRALSTVDGLVERGVAALLRPLYFCGSKSSDEAQNNRPAETLEKIHLQAFTRLTTQQLLPLFHWTSQLQEVCLRGCISVDAAAIKLLVQSAGKMLRVVNLNWTGVRLEGVEEIIRGCPNLEVLKIAHVQNLVRLSKEGDFHVAVADLFTSKNDGTVPAMMERVSRATIDEGIVPLGKLQKLKLRGTQVGNIGLGSLLKHCGSKLQSLDVSHTRFGGDGCVQILLVLLGFTFERYPIFRSIGSNNTLFKLNLSGLSIPEEEINVLPFSQLESLRVFDFNQIQSINMRTGSHDLGVGIRSEVLQNMLIRLGTLWSSNKRVSKSFTPADQTPECHHHASRRDQLSPPTYSFERVTVSNKIIGRFDINDPIHRCCGCPFKDVAMYAVKHLDLSQLDLTDTENLCDKNTTDWMGCQSMDLSGCALPLEVDWEAIGAARTLRRVNLSGTKVSEKDVERLLAINPYLTSINLTGCRGIPVTRRRRYFQTMEVQKV